MIQGYPDGHLDEHRHQAAGRADPGLLVELHLLLGQLLLVFTVFLLELGNLGLHVLHGLGGVELLYGQGVHQPADNNCQGYDGQPEVT